MAKAGLAGLLSELHRESLKPAGFGKDRNTFSRDRGGYIERFNFQGSSWSSAAETLLYLTVGVEFAEFGPAERDRVYFKRTHWAGRVDELDPGAPDDWRDSEAPTGRRSRRSSRNWCSGPASRSRLASPSCGRRIWLG